MYCEARLQQHYDLNEDAAEDRRFGKTMENLRKQYNNKKKLLKVASTTTSTSTKIFRENLVAVHKIKAQLTLKSLLMQEC